MKKVRIAITGATGFLGKEVLKYLDVNKFEFIFLGRRKPVDFLLKNDDELIYTWINADITNPDIVSNEKDRQILLSCEYVFHAAAYYDLKGSYRDCFLTNVVGTSNLLGFYRQSICLKEFHYVSTIAVIDPVGESLIHEDSLPFRNNFQDSYSQTKYAAEVLFRDFKFHNNVAKIIYRPGVIVASSLDAANFKMDGPYYFGKSLKKVRPLLNSLPFVLLSFNKSANLPMVPVDHVARFICMSLNQNFHDRRSTTYHLVSDHLPNVPELLTEIFNELAINTKLKESSFRFINDLLLTKLGIPKETIPFMFHCHSYDKSNTYRDFEEGFKSQYSDFKSTLMKSLKDV